MIDSYEIKRVNNEEILYLYLNFNDEFSRLNSDKKKKKFENIIKEFIKENEIAFKGTAVALVVGGTIVGNIILNNDSENTNNADNEIIYEEIINIDTTDSNEKVIDVETSTSNEEVVTVEDEMEESISPVEENNVIEEKNNNYEEKENYTSTKNNKESRTIKENKGENTKVEEEGNDQANIEESTKKEEEFEEINNDIYVRVKRKNGETINIELEEYIIGVVGAEMPASFNSQALMAQAIIARTYALKSISTGKILTDTESTQSYKSIEELRYMWGSSYNTYYNKIKNAIDSTQGLYLTYNGSYIEAVYHSTSNGKTEDAINVWGNSFPYLVSVESEYDSSNPSFIKEKNISYSELSTKLKIDVNVDTEFNILSKTIGDRIEIIEVDGTRYTGIEFRNILGLRSADFDIEKNDTGVVFTTRGYGHGVGMSQYGANGMAKAGYTYEQILKHYYRGVSINHL